MTLTADNRVVVYMGEDSPDGFVYKFVSADAWLETDGKANAKL
ncbi:alkaline phosphatase PhoX [Paenibacillus sp. N3.4]|nr:DUF839 domain-containing protein [Paenibacillus sp. N3.4]